MGMAKAEVTLEGYVRSGPNTKKVGSNNVMEFSIPVDKRKKNKETQEWETISTAWYKVAVWGEKIDEVPALKSGDFVRVTGKLESGEYTAKDGTIRPSLSVAFPEIELLESKSKDEEF